MSNLDVAMTVRLIAATRGGAQQATADIQKVEQAAKRLNGARGGEKLGRDLQNIVRPAAKAEKELLDVDRAAKRLGRAPGADRLARDLNKITTEAKRADDAVGRLSRNTGRLRGENGRFLPGGGVRAGAAEGALGAAGSLGLPPVAMGMGGLGVAGGAAAVGVMALTAGIAGAAREAMAFDDAMAEVQKAVELSPEAFAELEQTVLRLSRVTPLAKEEIALLVAQAGFAGRPVQDLARFATFAAKSAVAFGMGAEEAGDRLAKLGNIFGLTQDGIENIANAVNVLGDSTAAKESDIIEFLTRVGAAAKTFGLAERETAAFGSALLSLGVSPEVASSGFSAMITKMATASKQSKDFQKSLKTLGLSSKEVEGLIKKGPAAALVEIFQRIKKLAPEKQAGVLVDMMGLEYADDAARMAGAVDLIVEALNRVKDNDAAKGSVERAFKIFDDLDSSKLEKLSNQFASLGTNIGKMFTPAIGAAADGVASFLEKINATFERAAQIEALANKQAKGEDLTPEEKDKLAADADLKRSVKVAAARMDHPAIGVVQRQMELEREIASDEPAAAKGDIGAQSRLLNLRAQLNQVKAELEEAMKVPGAAEAVSQSMDAIAKAISGEGEQAVQEAQAIAERIKAMFNFTATPTISPQFAPTGGARMQDGSAVPMPPIRPQKMGTVGGAKFSQTNTFHINGAGDPKATGRAVAESLAGLGSGAGSLHDTVG